MKLDNVNRAYFIGIGGIGMSALARWFHANQHAVAGYDRTPTDLTTKLIEEGIEVHYEDNIEMIPSGFKEIEGTLIVYTPAIPAEHLEYNFFQDQGFEVMKRATVLGMLTENNYTIAVAGTHGKTTTSSMIAHLLRGSSSGCSAFVGGIMTNTNTNLIIGSKDAPIVVEADEYDRSFMQLNPNYIIITSLDLDHLDIYRDEKTMIDTYEAFTEKLPENGKLLIQSDASNRLNNERKYTSYEIREGDATTDALRIVNDTFVFTYRNKIEKIEGIHLALPGYHNVKNAVAAITVALDMGMDGKEIRKQMKSYAGVRRRFEYIFSSPKVTLIDDYAHHPEELEAFLKSVKSLAENRKITAIFQPHLYSRTNDFKEGFAKALDKADEIILLDIYPAREKPIPNVSSKSIYDLMKNDRKVMVSKDYLIKELEDYDLDIVLTIGAGDIDKEVPKVAAYLKNKFYPKNENP